VKARADARSQRITVQANAAFAAAQAQATKIRAASTVARARADLAIAQLVANQAAAAVPKTVKVAPIKSGPLPPAPPG
jgi:hypothetical protein